MLQQGNISDIYTWGEVSNISLHITEIPTKRIKLGWLVLHKISLFAFVRKYVSVFNEILPTFKRTSEVVTVSHFHFLKIRQSLMKQERKALISDISAYID